MIPRDQARGEAFRLYTPGFCTLNGDKAVITGFGNDFATVTSLISRMGVEYAWETVVRILKEGGKFNS